MITTIAQASELTAAEEAEKERQEAEQVDKLANINIANIIINIIIIIETIIIIIRTIILVTINILITAILNPQNLLRATFIIIIITMLSSGSCENS